MARKCQVCSRTSVGVADWVEAREAPAGVSMDKIGHRRRESTKQVGARDVLSVVIYTAKGEGCSGVANRTYTIESLMTLNFCVR